jgi:hypothetical protein
MDDAAELPAALPWTPFWRRAASFDPAKVFRG